MAIDVIESQGIFKIVGLIDDFRSVGEGTCGYPVLGKVDDVVEICDRFGVDSGFVAIGDNYARGNIQRKISAKHSQFRFVTTIHPNAIVSKNAIVGAGVIVMPGAVINSGCAVGDFCIVNTNSSLDHDSRLEAFSSLAPGVVTGGNVKIGQYSSVGIGASLLNGVHIGEHTVVGAGAVVIESVAAYRVAYGVPARVMRERMAGESYL